MEPCIRLLAPRSSEEDGRIECSAGTVGARAQYPSLEYVDFAYVPRLPWRTPTPSEYHAILSNGEPPQWGRWLQVLAVPDEVADAFAPLREASAATLAEVNGVIESPVGRRAIQIAREYACAVAAPRAVRAAAGVIVSPAQLPTVTSFPALRGLHIDSTWRLPLHHRRCAPLRFGLNVSGEDRHLLYIAADLEQMAGEMRRAGVAFEDDCEHPRSPAHRIRRAFMGAFSDVPVIKIAIRPGEAYIAPAENMIHDGCTLGRRTWDLLFTTQGLFSPVPASLQRS